MMSRPESLEWFVGWMNEGKIAYDDGKLWRMWEPRRLWLQDPKRAEKRCGNGYFTLRTLEGGVSRYVMAHRVIWTFFRGPIPDGMVINHLNSKRDDNRIENLETVTQLGNMRHCIEAGRFKPRPKGIENARARLTDEDVREIRASALPNDVLSRIYGIHPHYAYIIKTKRARASA